jgi:hypothetical protein
MRTVARRIVRRHDLQDIGAGRILPGVNEERGRTTFEIQRMFDLELEILDQFELPGQPLLRQPRVEAPKQQGTERVVTATRIAAGKDNDRGT